MTEDYSDQQNRQKIISKHVTDKRQRIMEAVETILDAVGENIHRDGLQDTPLRVAKSYEELLAGYQQDLREVVNGALFDVEHDEDMIIVDNISFDSMCEHHMLPFYGKAHVAYIPSDKVIGLSKIPRIIEMYARRLQVQERLTYQIANAIEEILQPKGIFVLLEGEHMCASLRGIQKKGMNMRTQTIRGVYKDDPDLRDQFLQVIQ